MNHEDNNYIVGKFAKIAIEEAYECFKNNEKERPVITNTGDVYWLAKESYDFEDNPDYWVSYNGLKLPIACLDVEAIKRSENKFRGYGGRKFKFKYPDGTIVESTNCWYNGKLLEEWLAIVPNEIKVEEL